MWLVTNIGFETTVYCTWSLPVHSICYDWFHEVGSRCRLQRYCTASLSSIDFLCMFMVMCKTTMVNEILVIMVAIFKIVCINFLVGWGKKVWSGNLGECMLPSECFYGVMCTGICVFVTELWFILSVCRPCHNSTCSYSIYEAVANLNLWFAVYFLFIF